MNLVDTQKKTYDLNIIAYCLMPNHYHLLIETRYNNLSSAIKGLNQYYAQYFNYKYDRVGALWQGRFKSWFVFNEKYLTVLIKYIERNPIKAGLASRIGEYPWASSTMEDLALNFADTAQLTEFFNTKYVRSHGPWDMPQNTSQSKTHSSPMGLQSGIKTSIGCGHTPQVQGTDVANKTAGSINTRNPSDLSGIVRSTSAPVIAFKKSLEQHFLIAKLSRKRDGISRAARDEAICAAYYDGYTQTQIAQYLGLTTAAISKRIKLINGVRPHLLTFDATALASSRFYS